MPTYLMLPSPSANHVYAAAAPGLAEAELALTLPSARAVERTVVGGLEYVAFEADELRGEEREILARQSARLALFRRDGDLLAPVELPAGRGLDEDLVTIPKYPGKTNEQFTRLLLNLTLAQVRGAGDGPWTVLDPLAGRGTTLTSAWLAGHHAAGVELDPKAVEQLNSFLCTWLRRKRVKHSISLDPVRREGKSLGKRLNVEIRPVGVTPLSLSVFTGDTRESARLWGKRRFEAIVTDAPYGVAHGSAGAGRRERSPAALLSEAIGVWAGQLRPGGALGLAWNTHGLSREALTAMLEEAGLTVATGERWLQLAHRVDSSIHRDVLVAVRPA